MLFLLQGGIFILLFVSILRVFYNSYFRKLAVDVGGEYGFNLFMNKTFRLDRYKTWYESKVMAELMYHRPNQLSFVLPISNHVIIPIGSCGIMLLFAFMAQLCIAWNILEKIKRWFIERLIKMTGI